MDGDQLPQGCRATVSTFYHHIPVIPGTQFDQPQKNERLS